MHREVDELIKKLNLMPHPEGGLFKETYRSKDVVKPNSNRYANELRSAGSSIYYLLSGADFSAWHRLKSDEIWHYHLGTTIIIYSITSDGKLGQEKLGNPLQDTSAKLQIIIEAGTWFAAELLDKNSYILLGCTVNPGFEMKDFELAENKLLTSSYPEHADIIKKLTR